MEIPHQMTTLTEVMEKLRINNMDNEFRMHEQGMSACKGKYYQPSDLQIIKVYRFEGPTDPADMMVLYIIQAQDGMTGYSLDAYGVYSDHEIGYDNFIRQIPIIHHEGQKLFSL